MAERLKNLTALFGNMRTRTILFATGGLLLIVVIVGLIGFRTTTKRQENSASVQTTRNIDSVPGLTAATPEYASVQSSLNEQNYIKAEKTQGTSIPTIIGKEKSDPNSQFQSIVGTPSSIQTTPQSMTAPNVQLPPQGSQAPTSTTSSASSSTSTQSADPALQQLAAQQKAQIASLQQQVDAVNDKTNQQEGQVLQSAMQQQARELMTSWGGPTGVSQQQYVEGVLQKNTSSSVSAGSTLTQGQNENAGSASKANNQSTAPTNQTPIIKAGDILFGVLQTAVNSDEPGPVLATVAQGPLKGAKLIGSMQQTVDIPGSNGATRLTLNFSTMSIPHAQSSFGISAVAIDLNTARTALASNVDHHYLERYGSLFASAFLEGYGNAVQQSGSTVTNSIFGGASQSYASLTGIQEIAVGLGQVGQQWGSQLGDVLNRPNTITVNSGTGVGILFLNDVSLSNNDLPTIPTQATNNG
jgi:intracellular multiplication protein IcmE